MNFFYVLKTGPSPIGVTIAENKIKNNYLQPELCLMFNLFSTTTQDNLKDGLEESFVVKVKPKL